MLRVATKCGRSASFCFRVFSLQESGGSCARCQMGGRRALRSLRRGRWDASERRKAAHSTLSLLSAEEMFRRASGPGDPSLAQHDRTFGLRCFNASPLHIITFRCDTVLSTRKGGGRRFVVDCWASESTHRRRVRKQAHVTPECPLR